MITEDDVIKTVLECVAKKRHKEPEDVSLTDFFTQDLGGDSLDMLEIGWDICKTYNIQNKPFEDELSKKSIVDITVDDIVTATCKLLGIERSTAKGPTTIIGLITIITKNRHNLIRVAKGITK